MRNARYVNFAGAVSLACLGALGASRASAASDVIATATTGEVNMWDGNWHAELSPYLWLPWIYTTAQLPPAAGGGSSTIETQPSQYLKYVQAALMFDGSLRKGDFSLWTDFLYMNLHATPSHTQHIGLPDVDATLPVTLNVDASLKAAVWTFAPTYTVLNNGIATLDILAGLRYSSIRVPIAYNFTAPPTPLNRGGGFWPSRTSTAGIIGVKGSVRLSGDGRWFLPYEADIGDGDKNWQYNLNGGFGYHFRWGDVTLTVRDLTYELKQTTILQKMRNSGPVLGASFRW